MAKRRLQANLSPAAVSGREMGAVGPGSSIDGRSDWTGMGLVAERQVAIMLKIMEFPCP